MLCIWAYAPDRYPVNQISLGYLVWIFHYQSCFWSSLHMCNSRYARFFAQKQTLSPCEMEMKQSTQVWQWEACRFKLISKFGKVIHRGLTPSVFISLQPCVQRAWSDRQNRENCITDIMVVCGISFLSCRIKPAILYSLSWEKAMLNAVRLTSGSTCLLL